MRLRAVVATLTSVLLAMAVVYAMLGELMTVPRLAGVICLLAVIGFAGYRLGRAPRS